MPSVYLLVLVGLSSSPGVSVRKPATSNRLSLGGSSSCPLLHTSMRAPQTTPHKPSVVYGATRQVVLVLVIPHARCGCDLWSTRRCTAWREGTHCRGTLLQLPFPSGGAAALSHEVPHQSHHIRKSERTKTKWEKWGACFSLWWSMWEHQWKVYLKAEVKLHLCWSSYSRQYLIGIAPYSVGNL